MASCLIIGDSIAAGIAAALSAMHPSACDARTRVGASVEMIISMVPTTYYRSVIISAGSNDRADATIAIHFARLREAINAKSITWIYPRSEKMAWAVYRVAHQNGDGAMGITIIKSRDGIHPSNYGAVVSAILGKIRIARKE